VKRNPSIAASVMCFALAAQPFVSVAQGSGQRSAAKAAPLTSDQRILHLLNRFTFGPTPEELTAVRKQGVYAWFEQQLHPAQINDGQLEERLAELPAMKLPVDELIARFPSGAVIRQIVNGKLSLPKDPTLAAVYQHRIDIYTEKEAKKAAANQNKAELAMAPTPATNAANSSPMAAATPAPAAPTAARPNYAELLDKTILGLPPAARVERVLAMRTQTYEEFHSGMKGPQRDQLTADLSPAQKEILASFDNPAKALTDELVSQRLLRDIYSQRQLEEVMTTFWMNHFNIFLHKNEETPYYLVSYERDVIRPRALGKFEDLLVATARSPAMMIYLDNSSSTGPDSKAADNFHRRQTNGKDTKSTPPGLNENYARELMELHTLGVNGGYTQKDVTEVARIFTGWTVDHRAVGGDFLFDETRHEPGVKRVLNHKVKEDGQKEGLKLLHLLATSPATAHFISNKLAIAFVSDTPPQKLVESMAKTFRETDGDIPSVLRTMVHSPEFWSPDSYQAKVKTPLEYVVSAARASGAQISNVMPLANYLNQMGMPLYGSVPPTGYPAKADAWVSTGALVTRMNFSLALASNRLNGIQTHWVEASPTVTAAPAENSDPPIVLIVPENPADPASEETRLEAQLIPTGVGDKTRQVALDHLAVLASPFGATVSPAKALNAKTQASNLEKQDALLAGLLLGSPEFQRR
jgi:uncharacterized protein (DUF1800 family)